MTIRTKLRKDAMKMAVSILQSAKDPNNLHKTHGKYLSVWTKCIKIVNKSTKPICKNQIKNLSPSL